MTIKLHLWLFVLCAGVGAYTLRSSDASQDVASSKINGESGVKTKSARRRRRRGSSSGSSGDLDKVNQALKDVQKEITSLKESFSKGIEAITKLVGKGGGKAPSPGPAPKGQAPAPPPPPPPPPPSGGSGKVPTGHTIALHNAKANRFLRMNHGRMDGSAHKGANELPGNWKWEKFYTKDVGGGKVGFYCAGHGRWMSAHQGDRMSHSNPGDARRNPGGWEHVTVVSAGGKVKLKTHRGTYVRMQGEKVTHSGSGSEDEITWTVVDLGKSNPPPPPPRG